MSEMEISRPSRHWFHIPVQITVAAFCIYWLRYVPAPNKAVLLLGGVAAIMALVEMWPMHKAVYILLIIGLMFIENRALNKDRADFAQAEASRRKEENQQFSNIGSTITNNVQKLFDNSATQFAKNMDRSNRIIAGVADTIKTETGGDSFAYITFTPEPANFQFNQFPATSVPQFLVSITSHGKYPVREIHAKMVDNERSRAAMEEYFKHPDGDWIKATQSGVMQYLYAYLRPQSAEAPSGDVELLGMYPFPKGDYERILIGFSSLNGIWDESLHLGRVNGTWHQCLSVFGPTVKQTMNPFIYCDSNWPEGRALAEKDWPRVKRLLPHQ
jgi:hypothetical protein